MTDPEASPIGTEELSAYVDGELGGDRRAVVERHLSGDAEAAGRIASYRRQDDLLRQAMAPLAEAGMSPGLGDAPEGAAARGGRRRWWMAAAAACLLVLAAAGGWLYRAEHSPRRMMAELARDAVAAHLSYLSGATAMRAPLHGAALAAALQQVVGSRASPPDLAKLGYTLLGGRAMEGPTGPAVALWYEDGGQHRTVTCYFVRSPYEEAPAYASGETPSYAVTTLRGVNVTYRLEEGFGYAVAGSLPSGQLMEIARLGNMEVSE